MASAPPPPPTPRGTTSSPRSPARPEHTNLRSTYRWLTDNGYYFDLLHEDATCFDAAQYGTLIIFDATVPHGTQPNASSNSRLILFLRYLTAPQLPAEAWRKRNAALRSIARRVGFEPDEREAMHLYLRETALGAAEFHS